MPTKPLRPCIVPGCPALIREGSRCERHRLPEKPRGTRNLPAAAATFTMGVSLTSSSWRNRIVGSGEKPASDFLANPDNWRIHPKPQQDALLGVLSEVGWVQQVVENVRTGNLIDGHLRISLALSQGDETPVPYVQVDLSEEEEQLVLATLDPLSAMAATDAAKLDELLHEVQTGDAALQTMLAELTSPCA